MKYFTKLIRWISSQEHLYFLFALLFIIPNCVFFFTEPLPVTVGIASLLIPLAFWMGVLLVARKPGIVVWCLLPVAEGYIRWGAVGASVSFRAVRDSG